MNAFSFVIDGDPCGKGRPRFSRQITKNGKEYVRAHTPKKTVDYEDYVRVCFLSQIGSKRFTKDTLLKADIKAYFPVPKSTPKWQIEYMESGLIRPLKKPDWDNIGKIITDALNEIAFHDDVQFIKGEVEKFYSIKPRIEVVLSELPYVSNKITKQKFLKWVNNRDKNNGSRNNS